LEQSTKSKRWYRSKILWANGIAFFALVAQGISGREVLDANAQVALLAFLNGLLRLATDSELV